MGRSKGISLRSLMRSKRMSRPSSRAPTHGCVFRPTNAMVPPPTWSGRFTSSERPCTDIRTRALIGSRSAISTSSCLLYTSPSPRD
eukprot:13375471-Alexandrium_andersonii.AAC.1